MSGSRNLPAIFSCEEEDFYTVKDSESSFLLLPDISRSDLLWKLGSTCLLPGGHISRQLLNWRTLCYPQAALRSILLAQEQGHIGVSIA